MQEYDSGCDSPLGCTTKTKLALTLGNKSMDELCVLDDLVGNESDYSSVCHRAINQIVDGCSQKKVGVNMNSGGKITTWCGHWAVEPARFGM